MDISGYLQSIPVATLQTYATGLDNVIANRISGNGTATQANIGLAIRGLNLQQESLESLMNLRGQVAAAILVAQRAPGSTFTVADMGDDSGSFGRGGRCG